MNLPKLKPYISKLEYSYCYGAYPTLDLFKYRGDKLIKILLHPNGRGTDGFREVEELARQNNIPVEFNERAIEKISSKGNTFVVGIFEKYQSDLDSASNHLVLDHIRNMGNLGTIIRTMVGFDYHNLAIVRPSADIFDPKVVRSAMGAMFQINFKYFESIDEYMNFHKRNMYLLHLEGSEDIRKVEFVAPFSIVMGNESKGLGPEYDRIGTKIRIPHSTDIDSLNLAVATAVTLWETSRN